MFIKIQKKLRQLLMFLSVIILISGCSSNEIDPVTGEKKIYEPNPQKKAAAYRDKGGGLFNTNTKSGTTYEFSTSNVLWRASLKTLESMPLQNIDYSGGVIITDWYSPSDKFTRESIKIKVRFLSNELAPSSIEVVGHKKICDATNACLIQLVSSSFNQKIKDKIILQAKNIKINEDKLINK